MQLALVRHLWGVDTGKDLEPRFAYWRDLGYEGIEAPLFAVSDFQRFRQALRDQAFFWIPQIFTGVDHSRSVEDHVRTLGEQMESCLEGRPIFFNAQSGCDAWSLQEAHKFFGRAVEIEKSIGVAVCHETHRSRYLGNPWNTMAILKRVPELKLTCDLSHWVCVAERLLPDCGEELAAAAGHCEHIHARVGYEEGPQIPDPRAPEWVNHLNAHETWWDQIWRAQRARGMQRSTLTPEFGPPPYMHTLPFTQQPLANLAEVCDWMALRQRERFAASQHGHGLM